VAIGKDGVTLRRLRALFNVGAIRELSDGQLLERFATGQGESAELAFAALVERHGPMVLRVCRGVLGDSDDAQDAFQATFLVLVRKARGLWVRDSIGPWLHQVAYRAASGARSAEARRRRLEQRAAESPARCGSGIGDELVRVIHEEIGRLPERFRSPVVLCDLEGRTHEQAARHLGWPIGTVKSRLSRARDRLRDRLSRRGLAADSGWLAIAVAAPIPAALVDVTAGAAVRSLATRAIAPGSAAMLAQGVIRSMIYLRWLKVGSALLIVSAATSGIALLAQDGPSNVTKPAVDRADDAPSVKVGPGRFRLALSERGVVQASKVADVHSEIEGRTVIVRIVPEGTKVKQGDFVCELDSAAFRDTLTNQKITAQQAEANYKQALLTREVAEYAIKEYREGLYKQDQQILKAEVARAQADIERARARLDRARRALEKLEEQGGPGAAKTPADVVAELLIGEILDDARRDNDREIVSPEQARSRRQAEKLARAKMVRDLEADIEKARADELAKLATWELEKSKAAKLERQIKACVLLAPADGVVVYGDDRRRPGQPMIEEGATVRERQKIFGVVDLGGPMRVIAKVHEPRVDRVSPGLRARIKIDALSGETFTGAVETVAPLPDVQQTFERGPKLYTTRVAIEKGSPMLRPGMTAEVEILIFELDNVLAVPVGSVVRFGGKDRVAVRLPDGGIELREVALGETNDEVVEVRRGLKAGEVVILDPVARMTEEEKRQKFGPPIKPTPPAAPR
jgi:HlyD family secretion protein